MICSRIVHFPILIKSIFPSKKCNHGLSFGEKEVEHVKILSDYFKNVVKKSKTKLLVPLPDFTWYWAKPK